MPRNGSGTYTLPAGNPVISNTAITTAWANSTLGDIASALSNSIAKDGQTPVTTNIPMAGFKHTNVAPASTPTDYARADQVQDEAFNRCINEGHVGDAYTAQTLLGDNTFINGQSFVLKFPATNTGTTPTLSINGSAAWSILREDGSTIVVGDCRSNVPSRVMFNDTAWLLLGAVVSASSIAGVTTWNTRAGDVVMNSADIIAAQPYVPVNKAGDTMTGPLVLPGNAALSLEAAPLQQVQALIAAIPTGGVTSFNGRTGAVTLIGTDVVSALGYTPANKNGDTFTGIVSAPNFRATNDGAASSPNYAWVNEPTTGLFRSGTGRLGLALSGTHSFSWHTTHFLANPGVSVLGWGDATYAAVDVGFWRPSAEVISIGHAGPNDYRDLYLRGLAASGGVTVAGSITASGGFVSNAASSIVGTTGTIASGPAGAYLMIQSAGPAHAAFMAFNHAGQFASNFGLDIDNQWKVGGWSAGVVSYVLLHEGNSFTGAGTATLNAGSKTIATTGMVSAGRISVIDYSVVGTSGSVTVDWNNGTNQSIRPTGAINITVINVPVGNIIRLLFNNTTFGITIGPTVYWPNGVTPNLNAGAIKWCLVVLEAISGTQFLGNASAH